MLKPGMLKSGIIAVALIALLNACSTPYVPTGLTGGFSVFPIDSLTYRITLNANRFTTINQAEEMALLKAAEITLQLGEQRFIVSQNSLRTKSVAGATPSYLAPLLAVTPGSSRPAGEITIRIVQKNEPLYARGLNAQAIYAALKNRYDHKGPRF